MNLVFPHTFVPWFRTVAPHIHAYRGETFVVAIAGELIDAGRLNPFAQDLAILHAIWAVPPGLYALVCWLVALDGALLVHRHAA